MAVTAVLRKARTTPHEISESEPEPIDWVRVASCGSLVFGGLLLLTGRRHAGLALAASGTALALLDDQDDIRKFWKELPGHLNRAQRIIAQAEDVVVEVAEKGESLRRAFAR